LCSFEGVGESRKHLQGVAQATVVQRPRQRFVRRPRLPHERRHVTRRLRQQRAGGVDGIVQRGIADTVVKAAQKAGAQGATVFYAHGTGVRQRRLGVLGVTVNAEKEVVYIVASTDQADRIFEKMFVAGKLEDFDAMTDAEIDRIAGFGAHEVRTWVAAAEAAKAVGALQSEGTGLLLITHHTRILNYLKPNRVLVMKDGLIVRNGGPELALEIEEKGFSNI